MIAISVDVFAATKSSGAADASTVQESTSFLEQYKRKIGSFGSILHLTSRSCRCGFCATSFITRCCIRLCRINFARQLFRIILFIFAVQQNFRDPLTERLWCEIALDSPPVANGNSTRLFGDDYRDGIRFLSYSEPGAMT